MVMCMDVPLLPLPGALAPVRLLLPIIEGAAPRVAPGRPQVSSQDIYAQQLLAHASAMER